MEKIIYQSEFVTISFTEKYNCMYQEWTGYIETEKWHEAHNLILEFSKKNRLVKIISNTKNLLLAKPEDITWCAEVVTPQLEKRGLKFVAFVQPEAEFGKATLNNFLDKNENKLVIKLFKTTDKAKEWILNQDE